MFPDASEAINSLDVTITPTMYVVALFVSFALQVIRAIVGRWPVLSEDIQDPLWPMVSIALCVLAFGCAGVENYLVAGAVMGLTAGGGYKLYKSTSALIKPKLPCAGPIA